MAAKQFLESDDLDKLTLRRVAELADVSAPTVYAHFPTMDDLAHAFFLWLKPHIGTDQALPPLSDFASVPKRFFPRYSRHGRLLRNLMNMPAWERLRIDDWKAKQDMWADAVKAEHPDLANVQTDRAAIALAAFSTPNMWRWLIDITGCSQAEAEQIAGWATSALVTSLQHDATQLSDPEVNNPTISSRHQKGTPS
jgi:AcrR family transcriptional regulator